VVQKAHFFLCNTDVSDLCVWTNMNQIKIILYLKTTDGANHIKG